MRELGARAVYTHDANACGGHIVQAHAGACGSIVFVVFYIVGFCYLVINKEELDYQT